VALPAFPPKQERRGDPVALRRIPQLVRSEHPAPSLRDARLRGPQRRRVQRDALITVGPADQPGTSIVLSSPALDSGLTDGERRTIVELAVRADRDDGERDGERASLFIAGARRPLRGSLASSVRPLPSPEVKRLGLVARMEVLRNG